MTYSVAPHLSPDPADAVPKTKKADYAPQQAKSVELAGSGVTSVFPSRLETNVGSKRGPNWLAGFLYWLRRKEKGRSRLAGFECHLCRASGLSHRVAPLAAEQSGRCMWCVLHRMWQMSKHRCSSAQNWLLQQVPCCEAVSYLCLLAVGWSPDRGSAQHQREREMRQSAALVATGRYVLDHVWRMLCECCLPPCL